MRDLVIAPIVSVGDTVGFVRFARPSALRTKASEGLPQEPRFTRLGKFFRPRSPIPGRPQAVVLGLGVNGLGVVRALAQERVTVVGVYEQAGEIGRYSRHCRAVSFPDVERDPEGFFRELCALGKQLGDRPVLFPTSDRQLELVSREREPLGKLFRFRLADHEVLDLLMDKALVLEAARRYGIGGPRTFIFRRPEDLSAAMETLPVPSVAKPRFPWRQNPGGVPKVTLLHSRDEIQAFIQRYGESAENLVFQEVIVGGDADHAFCTMYLSSSQRVVGVVTGETIHRYPPNLGRTASCVTRDIPELAEAGERFLAGERYLGLAELEFKRDRRDGLYKLFEVNTRTWAYNSLSPACGVNLVHLAYLEAIAEPLPEEPLRGRPGWTWVNSELEAGFLWKTLKQGRFAGLPWRSFRPKTAHSKFAWDDPQPALRGLFYRVGRLIHNLPGDDAGI